MHAGTARSVYSGARSTVDPLQRRVPKNPKYDHVQGVLDTGMNVRKVRNITTREYLKRKNELFKRVKPSSVYQLLCDHEEKDESIYDIGEAEVDGGGFAAAVNRGAAARDESKDNGASIQIVTHRATDDVKEVERKPYLILDVRDPEDFEVCHVTEAVSYPAPRISQDRITPQLYSYKNKADTMIIVYDDEEKVAAGVATAFVQKGWENVFLMSGGLKIAAAKYPLMVDGDLPERLASPTRPARGGGSSRMSTVSGGGGRSRGARSVRSSAASSRGGGGRTSRTRDVATSSPKTCATGRSFATNNATSGAWR